MKIINLQEGQRARRPRWSDGLYITREDDILIYKNPNGRTNQTVKSHSSAYEHNDFQLIKGHKMVAYKETKIITLDDKGNVTPHSTEEDALDYIADQLEANPRIKHTMFKPYQAIEPKRANLKDLIKKL